MTILVPGILLTAIAWLAAWGRFGIVTEFSFFPLWVGYILVINGVSEVLLQDSLIRRNGAFILGPIRFLGSAVVVLRVDELIRPQLALYLCPFSVLALRASSSEAFAASSLRTDWNRRVLCPSDLSERDISARLDRSPPPAGTARLYRRYAIFLAPAGKRPMPACWLDHDCHIVHRALVGDMELLFVAEVDLHDPLRGLLEDFRDASSGISWLSILRLDRLHLRGTGQFYFA
jgi:hypothetical protein